MIRRIFFFFFFTKPEAAIKERKRLCFSRSLPFSTRPALYNQYVHRHRTPTRVQMCPARGHSPEPPLCRHGLLTTSCKVHHFPRITGSVYLKESGHERREGTWLLCSLYSTFFRPTQNSDGAVVYFPPQLKLGFTHVIVSR